MTGLVRKLSEDSHVSQFSFTRDLFKSSDQPSKAFVKIFIGNSTSVVKLKLLFCEKF